MSRNGMFKTSLDYYKSFYYVAKFKSISLAAKELELTQPSMSNTIKKLEEDLGCKLFERTRNGVELTHEGKLLWEKVEPACDLIQQGESIVESAGTHGGVLNIVAYELGYLVYVIPALKRFQKDYPDVRINMLARTQDNLTNIVRMGLADLTIIFSPYVPEDEFKYTFIGKLQEKLAAGQDFAELKGRKVSLHEIKDYPFLTYRAGSAKTYLQRIFEKEGLIFDPKMEVTSISVMRDAIINNYGIGDIYPDISTLAEQAGMLFYIDLVEDLPERDVYAVTKKEMSSVARIFVEDYMKSGLRSDPEIKE